MRTAIFVRGHARTWTLTKEHVLGFFSDLYDGIEWYFAVLDTGTIGLDQIREDFGDHRLVDCRLVDPRGYTLPQNLDAVLKWRTFHTAYWRLAWMDYHLGKTKRQRERDTGMQYDNVLFIRPDVIYHAIPEARYKLTDAVNQMSVTEIGSNGDTPGDVSVGDLVIRAGAAAADLLTLRYADPTYTDGMAGQLVHGNSHTLLANNPIRRFIGYNRQRCGIESFLVRPDHVDLTDWNVECIDRGMRDSPTWSGRSTAERLDYCRRLGIAPEDYQLDIDH